MAANSNTERVCECDNAPHPLCGFCAADRYCPQCGEQVAFLVSPNAYGDHLLIYTAPGGPNEPAVFETRLTLVCRGAERERIERRPVLDAAGCTIETRAFFERQVVQQASDNPPEVRMRLQPLPERLQNSPRWYDQLPIEGLPAKILLRGDFPDCRFEAWVCRQPSFAWRLTGGNVLPDDPAGISDTFAGEPANENLEPPRGCRHWRIWQEGPAEWQLEIEALTAPVWLAPPFIDVTAEDMNAELVVPFDVVAPPFAESTCIIPRRPLPLRLAVEVGRWRPGERKTLAMQMTLAGLGAWREELTLEKVELGNLEFSVSDTALRLGPLYYGEVIHYGEDGLADHPLMIRNAATADTVWLRRPAIVPIKGFPGPPWLSISWDDDSMKQLGPGEEIVLPMTIDLSHCDASVLPEGSPLRADLVVQDDLGRTWKLPVVADRVGPRPRLESCLAIDFGSTNSYAAVWNADSTDEPVVPVLGDADNGEVPSAIFFRDVSDPLHPDYVIGRQAVELGRDWPLGLVTGLKRQIGLRQSGGQWPVRQIYDRNNNLATYEAPLLVRYLLGGIFRECERRLRKTVGRVGFSFPANAGSRRVRHFEKIIQDLADERPGELDCAPLLLDEAAAVVLSFALSQTTINRLKERLTASGQVGAEQADAAIASFDFGSGTIDTAVMEVRPQGAFGRLKTVYLGIGGDERFGGNNITLAVMEIIRHRLQALLNSSLADNDAIDLPVTSGDQSGGRAERENFETLWRVAERIKLAASLAADTAETSPLMPPELLSELLRLTADFGGGAGRRSRRLKDVPHCEASLLKGIEEGVFSVRLDDLYDHRLTRDQHDLGGYTVRERIRSSIEQLHAFTAGRGGALDYIVLAGGSCHLPLVQEMMREVFPTAEICFEPPPAKSKVAFGLARYFFACQQPAAVAHLSRSTDYTHAPIGLMAPSGEFVQIVPSCAPVRLDERSIWHPLQYRGAPLQWLDVIDSEQNRQVRLYQWRYPRPECIGAFRLAEAASDARLPHDPEKVVPLLPEEVPPEATIFLRMAGREDEMQLKLDFGSACYGFWRLSPVDAPTPSDARGTL